VERPTCPQFLVKELCQDELKMVSLYSGFDEQELIYEILEATSEANELKSGKSKALDLQADKSEAKDLQADKSKALDPKADKSMPNKKLWIFFDESTRQPCKA
jgi:hypothetical protein